MRHFWVILSAGLVLSLYLWGSSSVQLLIVESDERIVWSQRVQEGETFSLRWIHSVEGEEWEETFRIGPTLVLESTRFKTFGAGVPNDVGDDAFLRDGWVHMTGIERDVGNQILVRANQITNHRLFLGEREYVFELTENSARYAVRTEETFLFRYLFDRLTGLPQAGF